MKRMRPGAILLLFAALVLITGLATFHFMGGGLDLLAGDPVVQSRDELQHEALAPLSMNAGESTRSPVQGVDSGGTMRRLEALRDDPNARSDMQELSGAMVAHESPDVRRTAFEVARHLAVREGDTQILNLLKSTIRSPHSEVRREALRTCTTHPQFDLIEDLLQLAAQATEESFLAVQALAFLDDDRAQTAVLDVARSEQVPRSQRMRAVALLTRTQLSAGVLYLQELAKGDDHELRDCALAALSAMQQQYRR